MVRAVGMTFGISIFAGMILGIPLLIVAALSINILWSPVAALLTVCVARSQGLNPYNYAVKGARRSLCFVFPWLRLMVRMSDGKVPNNLRRFILGSVFAGWMFICTGLLFLFASLRVYDLATLDDDSPVWRDDELRSLMQVSAAVGFIAGFLSIAHWIFALWSALRHFAMEASVPHSRAALSKAIPIEEESPVTREPSTRQLEKHLHQAYLDEEYREYSKPWLYFFCWLMVVCIYVALLSFTGEYPFLS